MTAQQLKNSILQMAVQGKLVPQDPTDEPASVLLERIRAEKEKLIKEGKIKKEKNPSVIFRGSDNLPYEKVGKEVRCIADEIPFEIPDSWEWVRLGSICNFGECISAAPGVIPDEAWVLDLEDIEKDTGRLIQIKTKKETKCTSTKHAFEAGQILYSKLRPYLNKVVIAPNSGFCTSEILPLRFYGNLFIPYIQRFLMSPGFVEYTIQCSYGVKMPRLGTDDGKAAFVPIPPLSEQQRIVEKIEELLPHIEEYGKAESKVSKLNAEFPEKLKKSILQWAIQGKLVPQNPDDEPASVLLERIRAEKAKLIKEGKIKKDKNESIIFRRDNSHYEKLNGIERCIDDEIPFEIPENWSWVRLRNILNVVSARRVHQADWRSSGIPFYRAREIALLAEHGYVNNELFIDEKLFLTFAKDGIPSAGDLMITAVGTLGKSYIVKEKDQFYYKDASVICFENFAKISAEYIQNLLNSPYMIDTIKSASTGTTVGTITMVKANEYLIPLPPLAEQQRIVEAIESVFKKLTI